MALGTPNKHHSQEAVMIGYEGLVWVNDDKGRELVCTLDSVRPGVRRFDDLNEGERRSCRDVSEIVGTERW